MAYNQYPQQQRDFTFSPYKSQDNRSYQRNNYSRPQTTAKKHSGAKKTIYLNKEGAEKHLTSGWKLTKSQPYLSFVSMAFFLSF